MKHTILLVSVVAILGIALAAASLPTHISTNFAAAVPVQILDDDACGTDAPDAATEAQTQAQLQAFAAGYVPSAPGSIQIPVHFHVITHSDGRGVVTDAQIQEQINVINNSFAGLTGGLGTNTPFRVYLAETTRVVNDAWFLAPRESDEETQMFQTYRCGRSGRLHIYTKLTFRAVGSTEPGGIFGYSSFPEHYEPHPKPAYSRDGVVINFGTLPGVPGNSRSNTGDTGAHEVGHWLGLRHPFLGGCTYPNDFIDDTPAESTPARYACPTTTRDTCPDEPDVDATFNLMGGAEDACRGELTPNQSTRMDMMTQMFRSIPPKTNCAGCRCRTP